MQKKFESNILKNQLFSKKQKLLLAISGGIDSVVLAHLLKHSGFTFALAHCNFQLRGKDSTADEQFCKTLAKQLNVPFFVTRFNVEAYCLTHKQSIQMAARNLRYAWFSELLHAEKYDCLITAHHANDTVETVLINLLRGTGIKGLKGIPVKNGKILRPLLPFTKEEITAWAKQQKLKFRTDKSNASDAYERNFLRLNVIPKLKELNPTLEKTFTENSLRFAQEDAIVTDFLQKKATELQHIKNGLPVINTVKLKAERYGETILHFLLSPYGFNRTQQLNILEHIGSNATVGKLFSAPGNTLTIAKNELVIKPNTLTAFETITISSLPALKKQTVFKTGTLSRFKIPAKHELILNPGQLIYPLTIRTKQTGDKFKPFGMSGFKLVSDLLKEEKLNAFEKESCLLLVNGNGDIIWVAGYRSDERYKVNKTDTHLLKLSFNGNSGTGI